MKGQIGTVADQRSGRGRGRFRGGGSRRTTVPAEPPADGRCVPFLLLPLLMLALGILLNVTTFSEITGAPFFAAAPLVTAPFCTRGVTVGTGLIATALFAALLLLDGPSDLLDDSMRTLTVATVSALAVFISGIVRRSGAALDSARIIAEAAQRAVLPLPPPRIGRLEFAARYKAAQTGARIGGDLYAVQETPHGTRMLVGDVRGKGLGAVEAVVIVIGAFREAAEQEDTLEAVAGRLEGALRREGDRRRGLDQYEGFTTAVLVEVPAEDPGVLRVVNRGHPAPLLLKSDGFPSYIEPRVPALPLGMPELGEWPDRADEVPFPPGAHLLLYTDGLSEARGEGSGVFYEPSRRLAGCAFDGPDGLLDALVADVEAYTGGRITDDMALLVARRRGRL